MLVIRLSKDIKVEIQRRQAELYMACSDYGTNELFEGSAQDEGYCIFSSLCSFLVATELQSDNCGFEPTEACTVRYERQENIDVYRFEAAYQFGDELTTETTIEFVPYWNFLSCDAEVTIRFLNESGDSLEYIFDQLNMEDPTK